MSFVTEETLLEALSTRYAVKVFQRGAEILPETWAALENALVMTPSSYGLQPWKFVVVREPSLKKALRLYSFNQAQVEDCSHFVVFLARKTIDARWIERHMDRIREIYAPSEQKITSLRRAVSADVLEGPVSTQIASWAMQQCCIALGTLLTSAAMLGVDTCPIGGFFPDKYDVALKLNTDEWMTVMACAVGYRSLEDPRAERPKVRFPHEDVIERR